MIWDSLLISVSQFGTPIMFGSGFALLNAVDKSDEQAALGVAYCFNLLFFYCYYAAILGKVASTSRRPSALRTTRQLGRFSIKDYGSA